VRVVKKSGGNNSRRQFLGRNTKLRDHRRVVIKVGVEFDTQGGGKRSTRTIGKGARAGGFDGGSRR